MSQIFISLSAMEKTRYSQMSTQPMPFPVSHLQTAAPWCVLSLASADLKGSFMSYPFPLLGWQQKTHGQK